MKTITKLSFVILIVIAFSCRKDALSKNLLSSNSVDEQAAQTLHIGQNYQGGVICWLDATKQHGLIASKADLTSSIEWKKSKYVVTGATGTAIGTGLQNTDKIISVQGPTGRYAAKICRNYTAGGFTDWFLPSKSELNQLYAHKDKISGLEATNYWSSTEADQNNAYDQEFGGGFKFADDKGFTIHVRAMRAF